MATILNDAIMSFRGQAMARPRNLLFASTLKDLALFIKLRLSLLVLFTVSIGFWLASPRGLNMPLFGWLCLGSFLIIGGANAFNEILEREPDALMRRTAIRPLPSGRMNLRQAWAIAFSFSMAGFLILFFAVNSITALLALCALALYIFGYTPLKKYSPWCVLAGAFPGAIPAMMGPAAVHNAITPLGWMLFGIVFLWQFPHFCAIAWVAREDYAKAGFKVVAHPRDARFTAYQILLGSLALLGFSPLLAITRHTGPSYFLGAVLLSFLLLSYALLFWLRLSQAFAKKVMGAALVYLPLLYMLMLMDKGTLPW